MRLGGQAVQRQAISGKKGKAGGQGDDPRHGGPALQEIAANGGVRDLRDGGGKQHDEQEDEREQERDQLEAYPRREPAPGSSFPGLVERITHNL